MFEIDEETRNGIIGLLTSTFIILGTTAALMKYVIHHPFFDEKPKQETSNT